jgi:putative tryptophan/tyrosine transport system substrate-binding protein
VRNRWVIIAAIPALTLAASSCSERAKPDGKFTIGVTQIVSHETVDAVERGFEAGLAEAGFREGENLVFERQNAHGDIATTHTIAQGFLYSGVDLVHAMTTPASQAATQVITRIPVVFSAVTDPVSAGIVPANSASGRATGTNVTGVSDRWPVERQFETYLKLAPAAKTWGTIYNPGEANSVASLKEMREAAGRLGVTLIEATVSSSADVMQAMQSLGGRVQAIHGAADNTAGSAFESIIKVCNDKKIPLFIGDATLVRRGAAGGYGPSYYDIGRRAGAIAARVLRGERPGDIPWQTEETCSMIVNLPAARAQGLDIPEELLKQAAEVIR